MHKYIPGRGDIVWLVFDPQVGNEQAGRRPALVISPTYYNIKNRTALFCPITSNMQFYPYKIALPSVIETRGAVLCDQIKSQDYTGRKIKFIEKLPMIYFEEVSAKIMTLVEIED